MPLIKHVRAAHQMMMNVENNGKLEKRILYNHPRGKCFRQQLLIKPSYPV
jgi:hypothetical protein